MFLRRDGSGSERKEVDGEKQRCTHGRSNHIWFCHGVTQRKKMKKNDKKHGCTYYNKPVSTRGIAGMGSGMLQWAKNQNCTRNCGTRFKSTAGLPVPVLNPKEADQRDGVLKSVETHLGDLPLPLPTNQRLLWLTRLSSLQFVCQPCEALNIF
jgi:hypothetical protein